MRDIQLVHQPLNIARSYVLEQPGLASLVQGKARKYVIAEPRSIIVTVPQLAC
jgi:hypothetical protein